jgi:hypothetical protein
MAKNERRVQPRFSLQLQAKFSSAADDGSNTVQEETVAVNISSTGVLLSTQRKLPLTSRVSLEFLVDLEELKKLRFILSLNSLKSLVGKKTWIKATGIVIRCDTDGIGIIFDQDYQLSPLETPDHQ